MNQVDHAEPDGRFDAARAEKRRVRADAKLRRAALDADRRAAWSEAAAHRLGSLLPPDGAVLTYVAMRDELDLGALNERLAVEGRLVLPRVEGTRLAPVRHDQHGELVVSRFGVPEPTGAAIDPLELAAVVVPGLAFDPDGYRVGYGAGFYDRFLPSLGAGCVVIGVCFSAQMIPDVPREPHDVPVPVVVTEGT